MPWHVDMAVWILIYLFMWKEYIRCTRGLHPLCLMWFGMFYSINYSHYISTGANATCRVCLPDVAFLTHGGSSGENLILSDSFNPGHFRLVLGMSPCDIPLQLSMKSFSSFHAEPEAEVPSAKPLTALFILVPLQELLGECTAPVSLFIPPAGNLVSQDFTTWLSLPLAFFFPKTASIPSRWWMPWWEMTRAWWEVLGNLHQSLRESGTPRVD